MTDDLAIGLGIDRLLPPAIVAFFQGLPRRVAATLTADGAGSDPASATGHEIKSDHEGQRRVTGEAVDALTAMADAIDRAVDRAKSVGVPIEPATGATSTGWPTLGPDVAAQAERVETGSVEVARRLAGLSSTTWGADTTLLGDMRDAVVAVTRPLRDLEGLADEDGIWARPAGEPGAEGDSTAVRSARSSNEALPEDQSDIEAAQRALEIANDSPTSRPVSAPPPRPTPNDDR